MNGIDAFLVNHYGMTWLSGLITGTATLIGVLVGSRLAVRTERKQWLRDNRLRVCVALIEQVETFISEKQARRTEMDKSVGTLIILGPAELAGQAGTLVTQAAALQTALFAPSASDEQYQAFRTAEWSFRAAATKALGISNSMTMAEVDRAAASLARNESVSTGEP